MQGLGILQYHTVHVNRENGLCWQWWPFNDSDIMMSVLTFFFFLFIVCALIARACIRFQWWIFYLHPAQMQESPHFAFRNNAYEPRYTIWLPSRNLLYILCFVSFYTHFFSCNWNKSKHYRITKAREFLWYLFNKIWGIPEKWTGCHLLSLLTWNHFTRSCYVFVLKLACNTW